MNSWTHTRGKIELICGCMFSGKTELLLDRHAEAQARGIAVAIFKHASDVRYAAEWMVSHSGRCCEAMAVEMAHEMLAHAEGVRLVLVDEAQFFGEELRAVCDELARSGCDVVLAGLDRDAWGQPFGQMPSIAAMADVVIRTRGVCAGCGAEAEYTQRVAPIEGAIMVGGKGVYEPRCAICFRAPPMELRR
jgi:thymidine kinase